MRFRQPGTRSLSYLLLAILVGMAMFLVWHSTVWGAGLISDSFQYTASARNFALGRGLSLPYGDGALEPMTKYPPMFPVLLAGFELAGVKALQGARILNTVLFGVNTFLVFLSVHRLTRSYLASLLASLLFSISFVMVEVHAWALSEPLYICLGLAAFLLIQRYFEEPDLTGLLPAALAVSFAFLTRYAGISLVFSTALLLVVHAGRQRVRDVLLFGAVALLPAALWTLRGYLLTRTLNDRLVGFHPLTLKNYVSAIDVLYGWLLPPSIVQGGEKLLLGLSVLGLVGLVLFMRSRQTSPVEWVDLPLPARRIVFLHVLYPVVYGLTIVASKTWIDPDIGLSDRILSPMLVSLLIVLALLFSLLWKDMGKARPLIVLVSLGLIVYYAAGTFTTVQRFHETGIGIARRGWNRSEAIQSLRSYASIPIYTNSNSSLYLWSERAGYSIPEFEQLKEIGADRRVLLVIFHHLPPAGKRLDELTRGLEVLAEDQVVSIYALSPDR